MATKQKKIIIHIYTWLLTIIASLYKYVFEAKSKTRRGNIPMRIVLLISRPQDVDLLISLHEKAKHREDMRVFFWMLKKIDSRSIETPLYHYQDGQCRRYLNLHTTTRL